MLFVTLTWWGTFVTILVIQRFSITYMDKLGVRALCMRFFFINNKTRLVDRSIVTIMLFKICSTLLYWHMAVNKCIGECVPVDGYC